MNQKQKSGKGRPQANSHSNLQVQHEARQQKAETVKQYWTEHRITLIAYQAQYVRNKKKQQQDNKKGNARKKIDLKYESGFLFADEGDRQQPKVQQRLSKYPHLSKLQLTTDQDMIQVKQMVKIMLQLKSPKILQEFLIIYNQIIGYLEDVDFKKVQKESERNIWLDQKQKILIELIKSKDKQFLYFSEYFKQDGIDTERLIRAQIYCFLAEKFNFNINEYYSEAFAITLQGKHKKVKTNQDKP